LYSENAKSHYAGIDAADGQVKDCNAARIYDSLETKSWAMKLCFDATLTILRVD